jgi:hypothetical protein
MAPLHAATGRLNTLAAKKLTLNNFVEEKKRTLRDRFASATTLVTLLAVTGAVAIAYVVVLGL